MRKGIPKFMNGRTPELDTKLWKLEEALIRVASMGEKTIQQLAIELEDTPERVRMALKSLGSYSGISVVYTSAGVTIKEFKK